MRELVEKLRSALQKAQLEAVVFGRVKNFYRIYKKMNEQKRNLKDIHDLIGARVICNSVNECYETLAVIQNSFKLETQGFDDYIQKPKKTKYQSIHVDLDWKGIPSEIQIRTWEMHKEAEEGVAAHWEYKQYKKDPTQTDHRSDKTRKRKKNRNRKSDVPEKRAVPSRQMLLADSGR